MFYKSDFKNVDLNYKEKAFFKVNHKPISLNILSNFHGKSVAKSSDFKRKFKNDELSWWHRYCTGTSVHGIKYLVERDLHWIERYSYIAYYVNETRDLYYFLMVH
jgi:hypothetical protein